MAEIRDFYVPVGASSNFLARMCLWAGDGNSQTANHNVHKEKRNNTVNEYFVERNRITGDTFTDFEIVNEEYHLVKETDEILPLLKELDAQIDLRKKTHPHLWFSEFNSDLRKDIINNSIYHFWKFPATFKHQSFLCQFDGTNNFPSNETSLEVREIVTKVQDYFTVCREFYFKFILDNGWSADAITHIPQSILMSNLKFPSRFKTLSMKTDKASFLFITALGMIKGSGIDENKLIKIKNTDFIERGDFNEFTQIKIDTNSGDFVDYGKVFFDNNFYEIKKMYDFFDNGDYFNNNQKEILTEFKKYNDDNVNLIKNNNLEELIYGK